MHHFGSSQNFDVLGQSFSSIVKHSMAPDPWLHRDPWGGSARPRQTLSDKQDSGPSESVYTPSLSPASRLSIDLLSAVAASRASRQVVAACTSALWRLERGCGLPEPSEIEEEIADRLAAIAVPLKAQVLAGGQAHTSRGLVPDDACLRANGAKHQFMHNKPFHEVPNSAIRKAQRGQRTTNAPESVLSLEDAPVTSSEPRTADEMETRACNEAADANQPVNLEALMSKVAADNATCIQKQVEAKFDSIPGIIGALLDQKNTFMATTLSSSFQKEFRALDEQWQYLIDTVDQKLSKRIEALEDVLAATRSLSSSGLPIAPGVSSPPLQCAVPCKFFQSGECNRGDACRFSHAPIRWSAPSREANSDIAEDVPDALHAGVPQFPVGATVRILGIVSCPELNDRFGVVKEYVPTSGRYRVQVDPDTTKALRDCNLQYPARCSNCGGEVTSSKCFSCTPAPSELPD